VGPLFSALIVVVAAGGLTALIFATMCFFWRWRFAAAFAVVFVAALGVGFLFGTMLQTPFLPETLTSTWAVFRFFAFATMSGVVFASLAAGFTVRWFKHAR